MEAGDLDPNLPKLGAELATELTAKSASESVSESAASVDQLLVQTAEEEEMEAQGHNSSETYDDDFLIMEEVNEYDELVQCEGLKQSAKRESTPVQESLPSGSKSDAPFPITVIQLDDDNAKDVGEGVNQVENTLAVGEPKVVAVFCKKDPAADGVVEKEVAATVDAAGAFIEEDKKVAAETDKEVPAELDGKAPPTEPDKKPVPAEADNKVATEKDKVVAEEDNKAAEEDMGAAEEYEKMAAEADEEATIGEAMEEGVQTIDLCSEVDEKDVEDTNVLAKLESKGDDAENPPEESEAGKENESPVLNGGLKEDPEPAEGLTGEPKKRRRLASGYSSLAELKQALGVTDCSDTTLDGSKRMKVEDGSESDKGVLTRSKSETPPAVGIPVGPNLVVLSRAQLEAYVAQRVRESLALQGQALLQPMEKKCDMLHRALERWRRRSFQLQKQLNEFICEQERCAGARRHRVTQRSVGVCVRMPPLKVPTVTQMAATRPAISVPNSTVAAGVNRPAQPAQGAVQQVRVTGANANSLAAQLGFKPHQAMKLVSLSSPTGGTTTVVTRMPPQVGSPSASPNIPIPVQLIANTGNPSQQVKSVSLPGGTTVGSTVVRTVAVVSSPSSTSTTSSQVVKFIDLTQEEEGGHARTISMPAVSMAGNTVQKITMPQTSIPILSAAPTSLVQVSPSTSQPALRAPTAVSSGVMTQAGGSFRLAQSMMTQPRVTYLVPSLPPNMVMTPKESGPRIISGAPNTGTPLQMQTILLRMPQGGFTTVPANAITMGNLTPMPGVGGSPGGVGTTMMVQTPAGSQVRMIRAPPPLSLPRGGTTVTLPPGTTLVRGPPTQGGGVALVGGTPVVGVSGGPASSPSTVRVPLPGQVHKQTIVVEAKSSSVVPVAGTVAVPAGTSVLGKVDMPASATVPSAAAKHPAPLPPTARYLDDPKKKRLPPKPALKITKAASAEEDPAANMDQVLEQWQAFLNTPEGDKKSNGAGASSNNNSGRRNVVTPTEDGGTGPKRRLRMPYHALRPLRLACLCRLGTCRYDKLSASYKERLHADFGRLQPEKQLRLLVARMYSEGLVRSKVPKKGRCKWMYWLPASGAGQSKRRVCKAGFMAVHGISEKRVRDVQLLWMRLRRTRGSTPTGEESELENESYLAELVEVEGKKEEDEEEDRETAKPARKPARKPATGRRRPRKILRESSDDDSSRDAEDEYDEDNSGPNLAKFQQAYQRLEEARKRQQAAAAAREAAATKAVASTSAVKRARTEWGNEAQTGEDMRSGAGTEGNTGAGGNIDEDEEEAPFMDISAFEPICSLEEDTENLVLTLPRGIFSDDGPSTSQASNNDT